MRKLILQMQMSVDGFVGADGDYAWQVWNWGDDNGWDQELRAGFNTLFRSIEVVNRKAPED